MLSGLLGLENQIENLCKYIVVGIAQLVGSRCRLQRQSAWNAGA